MRYLLLILTTFVLLQSCISQKRCSRQFPCKESTHSSDSTVTKDSLIKVEKSKAFLQVSIDSLKSLVQYLPVKISDSTKQATITITRDQYNNLLIGCECEPENIYVPQIQYKEKKVKEIVYIDKPVPFEVPVIDYKTTGWVKQLIGWLIFFLLLSNAKRIYRLIKPI